MDEQPMQPEELREARRKHREAKRSREVAQGIHDMTRRLNSHFIEKNGPPFRIWCDDFVFHQICEGARKEVLEEFRRAGWVVRDFGFFVTFNVPRAPRLQPSEVSPYGGCYTPREQRPPNARPPRSGSSVPPKANGVPPETPLPPIRRKP